MDPSMHSWQRPSHKNVPENCSMAEMTNDVEGLLQIPQSLLFVVRQQGCMSAHPNTKCLIANEGKPNDASQ